MNFTRPLQKNRQFRTVYGKAKSVSGRNMALYVMKNSLEFNRFGVSVSKKVGNSVKRNRARRLIKESYRLMEKDCECGFDIIVIARKPSPYAKFSEIQAEMAVLFKKTPAGRKNLND